MKHLAIVFGSLFLSISCFAQEKRAELKVNRFYVDESTYKIDFSITDLRPYDDSDNGRYLIFFMLFGTRPIQVIQITRQDSDDDFLIVNKANINYSLTLKPKTFREGNFNLYPILIEGNILSLTKVLKVIESDFFKITDVLSILYRANLKPLTYTVIER